MFEILIIFLIIILVLSIPTIYAGIIGAPLIWTPKKAIREALKYLNLPRESKVYDLGAGNGRFLVIADKEFNLNTVGFELSPLFYFFSRINIFFKNAKKTKIFMVNAYNQDLSEADAIFCFLSMHGMKKLKDKFQKELKIGAKIMSYGFKIKEWEPEKTIIGYPGKVYIYTVPK